VPCLRLVLLLILKDRPVARANEGGRAEMLCSLACDHDSRSPASKEVVTVAPLVIRSQDPVRPHQGPEHRLHCGIPGGARHRSQGSAGGRRRRESDHRRTQCPPASLRLCLHHRRDRSDPTPTALGYGPARGFAFKTRRHPSLCQSRPHLFSIPPAISVEWRMGAR
jgi:hypothetical protein